MPSQPTEKNPRSPIHYTVYQPNVLLSANTQLRLAEIRLYTEILGFNHQEEPERLVYQIPYEWVTHAEARTAQIKAKSECMRIAKSLQKRVFELDAAFMKAHFNEKYEISFNPFPVIRYKERHFEVQLNLYFKAILTKLELGFTKGDLEFLRGLNHEYSHRMYWLIRYEQWKSQANVLTLPLEELKIALGCANQYQNRFNNFRVKVLDVVMEELKGSWVDFTYELHRGGRGAKVVDSVSVHFVNDQTQERMLRLGAFYPFEEILSKYGLQEREIKRIREWVRTSKSLNETYVWTEAYVEAGIQLLKEIYLRKSQGPGSKIKNVSAYLYSCLTSGVWIEEIVARYSPDTFDLKLQGAYKARSTPKRYDHTEINQSLHSEPKKRLKKDIYKIPYTGFKDTYEAYRQAVDAHISEEEFAAYFGYVREGDFVLKK